MATFVPTRHHLIEGVLPDDTDDVPRAKRRRGILAQLLPACAHGVSLDVLVGGGEDQRRRARVQLVSQGRRCGAKHCAELPPSRELAGAEQDDRICLVQCSDFMTCSRTESVASVLMVPL